MQINNITEQVYIVTIKQYQIVTISVTIIVTFLVHHQERKYISIIWKW